MSTSHGTWSGIDRRQAQDFGYFERGGIERRAIPDRFDMPDRQSHWLRFGDASASQKGESTPRPIEWFSLLFFVVLLSALCWGGVAWMVAQVIEFVNS